MLGALVKRLGLDRLEEVLADELRKARLQVLQEERTFLLGQVARIDERIRGLGWKRGPGRPRSAASAKRAPTVAPADAKAHAKRRGGRQPGGMIQGLLRKALADGASVSIAQLVERVMKAGYEGKASPSNFRIMLVKALKNRAFFRKVRRGVYRLRKESAAEGQAEK